MTSKKRPDSPPGSAGNQRNPLKIFRTVLIVAGYLIAFVILDHITKQFAELRGVVAWYPPVGLTYALLLVFGIKFLPIVTVALLFDSFLIYRMPQASYLLILWAIIISLIYAAAAAFLRMRVRLDGQLRKLRDAAWFIFTTVIISALLAVLSVSSSALSSAMPRSEVLRSIFLWWVGETVGVLTVTPFLLIHMMPWLKRFAEGQSARLPMRWSFSLPSLSAIGQGASIALTLYWVFGAPTLAEYQPLYLITLPLIWIALTRGLKGVSAALLVVNSGVVLALWIFRFDLARLGELELFMIVNCIVCLLIGVVVTERKQTERTLHSSKEQYRTLIEQASDGIFIADGEGRYSGVNSAGCRLLGYTREEILRKTISDLTKVTPDHPLLLDDLLRGKTLLEEREMIKKDGTLVPVEISAKQLPDGRLQAIVRDSTARKQAEKALLESHLLLTKTLSSLLDAVFIIDYDTVRIKDCNPAASKIFGYSRQELLGQTTRFLHVDMATLEEFRQHLDSEVKTKGFLIIPEYRMKRKDGTVFPAEHSVIPFDNEQGKRIGWVSVVRDISERKQAEEAIRHLNADLEQRVEERTRELQQAQEKLVRQEKLTVLGQLAGGVGHELRNPLGVINTSIYFLKLVLPDANEKVKQHLEMITKEIHNADKIISDLLDFGRVVSAEPEPIALPGLVQRVLVRFPVPPSVEVTLKLPANLPMVFADPHQVEQILGNLVTNAWQAMTTAPGVKTATGVLKGGKMEISAVAGDDGSNLEDGDKGMLAIEVKDNGTGITPENMQKLFEPLFSTKAKGIGLGLAVSRKLAEANGGRLEVQSQPGQGSTFTLILPVKL
jgi:PAS domain S-box-containing protein